MRNQLGDPARGPLGTLMGNKGQPQYGHIILSAEPDIVATDKWCTG